MTNLHAPKLPRRTVGTGRTHSGNPLTLVTRRHHDVMLRAAAFVIDGLLGLALIGLVPFAWIMRDGLGPDAVDSSGVAALGRWFMTFWAGPIMITLIAAAMGVRWAARKPTE